MNLKEVCRTCLLPSKPMLPIFSPVKIPNLEFTDLPILHLLNIFTGISIFRNDGISDQICNDCLSEIQQMYAFKLKCKKSETILKQLRDDGKTVIDPNEYEHYLHTETSIEIIKIKTENTVEYEILQDKQSEETGLPETFLVQEIKQEPEIDITTEEADSEQIGYNVESFICSNLLIKKSLTNPIENEREKEFRCTKCSKVIEGDIRQHIEFHAEESRIQCEICLKTFPHKSNLLKHMVVHTEARPFQCNFCLSTFRSKECLRKHMANCDLGTNNRKFKCSKCPSTFGHRCNLIRHMKVHNEEGPFYCEVCQKKYTSKTYLTTHMKRVHSIVVNAN